MFEFLKGKQSNAHQLGIRVMEQGVALARVKPGKGESPPVLEQCEFYPAGAKTKTSAILKKLSKEPGIGKIICHTLVSRDSYELLMVEAPDVPKEELREAVRWKMKDMIHFPIADAVVEVFDIPDQKSSGDMMIYAIVAKAAEVRSRIDQFLNVGFRLESVDVYELAMKNLLRLLPENERGVALVSLQSGGSYLTLNKENTLYFSRQLVSAEPLFTHLYSETLNEDMEGWLDSLIIDVQRSLDFYEDQYQQPQVSAVVLAPMEKQISGVCEYLSSQLGIKVRMLDINELFELEEALPMEIQAICLPAVAAALRNEEIFV